MPRRGRDRPPSAVFNNNFVIAQASDAAWAHCSMTLRFDRVRSRGMLAVRFMAEYEGLDGTQHVSLHLTPHNIYQMHTSFGAERVPPSIAEHILQHATIKSLEEILIISVSISAPGSVICPQAAATLTPVAAYQSSVRCFQDVCRATEIRFYLPASNLSPSRRLALNEFIRMTTANQLAPSDINLYTLQAGRRGRKATWEVFNIPEPPPPYIPSQTGKSTGKRTRQASSPSASAAATKRAASGDGPAPSPSSRTHVSNTTDVDTDSDSGSESLTYALPSSKQQQQREIDSSSTSSSKATAALWDMVATELATLLPDMLRNLLPEMLRIHLSDMLHQQDSQTEASHQEEQSNRPPPPLIAQYVQPLVLAHLPRLIGEYMDEYGDMDNVVDAAETNLAEVGDSAVLEIKEAKDRCLEEIEAAERDACERLQTIDWDGDTIRGLTPKGFSPGRGAGIAAVLGPGLPKSEQGERGSEASSIGFKRRRKGRAQENGAESMSVAQMQQSGHHGQPLGARQVVGEETTEDDMTDEEDAMAGHDDYGPTTLRDEPGQQDEENRTHEPIQNGSIIAADGTGHVTTAAPPFSRSFIYSGTTNRTDSDVSDQGKTDGKDLFSTTQEDSDISGRVEAYRREMYATVGAVGASTTRSRSSEIRQWDSFLPRPDVQTGGNVRSAQVEEGNWSGTQFQYAQAVDDHFSMPLDQHSSTQPDTELDIEDKRGS